MNLTGKDVTPSADPNVSSTLAGVVLGVLFSLTVKSALEHTFENVQAYPAPSIESFPTFFTHIFSNFGLKLILLAKLTIFLGTLARFYLGAYRYVEMTVAIPTTFPKRFINASGPLLLFSGFYLCSLTLRKATLFYWLVIAFMVIDFVWFFLVIDDVKDSIKKVVHFWQKLDALTVLTVGLVTYVWPNSFGEIIALSIMGGTGAWDLYKLRWFYVSDRKWEERTWKPIEASA